MQYLYSFQFIEYEDTKVHKKYFNDCFSSVNSLFIMLVSLIIELQNKSQKQLNISKRSISGIQNKKYLSKNFSQNLLIKNWLNDPIIFEQIANNASAISTSISENHLVCLACFLSEFIIRPVALENARMGRKQWFLQGLFRHQC